MAPCLRSCAVVVAALLASASSVEAANVRRAVAVIFPSELGVARGLDISGRVIFTQTIDSEVQADIQISGLPSDGMHGFHVHQASSLNTYVCMYVCMCENGFLNDVKFVP
jgi:Cu/Zn superoxide dismutase